MKKHSVLKKLGRSVILLVLLLACFTITTFALVYSSVSIDENTFSAGTVSVNLNNGAPIIEDGEAIFEPGAIIKRDFFIENTGTSDVYYRLYFSDISGTLADCLSVEICNGEKTLYSAMLSDLTRDKTIAADDILAVGETRNLQIYFHLGEDVDNTAAAQELSFIFSADATQVKNNTDKEFD